MNYELLGEVNKWFWNDDIWLPPNITWKDISDTEKVKYAQFADLNYAFYVAAVLLVVRFVLERYVFSPLGCYFGLKHRPKKALGNLLLEKAFRANGRIGYKQIQGLAKQLDWTERRVERWLRQRTIQGKPTTLAKFTESSWRFTFYISAFFYGLYTLQDKPWLWDTKNCWYEYPHHNVSEDIWWYYMIELGFYWSLTFSQFLDIKRKDFLQMFVHHIVTIMLLTFSWTSNLVRIGTLVLIIHDFADCPLESCHLWQESRYPKGLTLIITPGCTLADVEQTWVVDLLLTIAAKMAKYIGKQRVADVLFVIFTLAWIISRLGLYPYRVIYSTMFEAITIVPMFPAYYVFNSLLGALQVLHIIWTWMIVRIALQATSSKDPGVKDLRSESDASSSSSCSCSSSSSQRNNHREHVSS